MDAKKIKKLEAAGWKVGSVEDFLGLTQEELEYIDLKISLAKQFSEYRKQKKLTQKKVAEMLGSEQSRISKMESGDASVSIDLILRALFALGLKKENIFSFNALQ